MRGIGETPQCGSNLFCEERIPHRDSLQHDEHEEAHQPPAESDELNIHRVNCELRGVLLLRHLMQHDEHQVYFRTGYMHQLKFGFFFNKNAFVPAT